MYVSIFKVLILQKAPAELSFCVGLLYFFIMAPLCLANAQDATGNKAPTVIVALGDSLVAGYQLQPEDAFPAQLKRALEKEHYAVKMINAGVSGDTSSDGRARLPWVLKHKPEMVIVELGANDMLRGLPPQLVRDNLEAVLKELDAAHIKILLCGMKAPANLGAAYQQQFDAIYPALAAQYHAVLYPFFLAKTYNNPELKLEDGLHPNARGIAAITQDILPYVKKLL
jgi:acyl-CoA thioesterase-1